MPYIVRDERKLFDRHIELIALNWTNLTDRDPGVLNYIISQLLAESIKLADAGRGSKPNNYEFYNAVVGVLDSAKAEFQRCVVNPYEKAKAEQNGGVYGN